MSAHDEDTCPSCHGRLSERAHRDGIHIICRMRASPKGVPPPEDLPRTPSKTDQADASDLRDGTPTRGHMTRGSAPSGDAAIECGPPPGSVNPGGTGGVPGHANDGVAALASLWERCMLAFGTREQPVVRFGSPNDLAERIASALPISLDYCQAKDPAPPEHLLRAVEEVIANSVHTDNPRFFNQNFSGADPYAVLGDAFGALLNTTVATFEVGPVFTLLERELTSRMAEIAGFGRPPPGSSDPAGIFCPGGSTCNLYAMQVARARAYPDLLEHGAVGGPRLVAFTSAESHYSIDKSAMLLGLGKAGVVKVSCDASGAMLPEALSAAVVETVRQGRVPFFINATAGTTVAAAFDDIAALSHIAKDADSITWNLHKMTGCTQQTSVLLVKDRTLLRSTFSTKAAYLFQADKNNAGQDLGDCTFQCARRNDALKAWLMWKARGEDFLGARIDHSVDLATRLETWVKHSDEFYLQMPRNFANVLFWWVPPDMRASFDPNCLDRASHERLHKLAPAVKNLMQQDGSVLVGYQPIAGYPNSWRMIFINPAVTWEDTMYAMNTIAHFSQQKCLSDL